MSTTRRSVLLQGSVIGAGLIVANIPGVVALAQAQNQGPPLRRSLQGLAWNDPIVATYRDAVGIMKQMPTSEKFNWVKLSEIHGSRTSGYKFCPHGNWYFLPWHRAFTATYERIVRHLTNNNDFAMPFWDWTANPLMPEVFLSPKTPDGKTNWLFVTDQGVQRTWPPTTPMPNNIVGQNVLNTILAASPYEIFGTSRPRGQDSLDPRWVTTRTGTQGVLEFTPHNNVHNNIGGWMPSPSSPRDPIFFMHHSNIDRIWDLWNLNHANTGESLWTDMKFTDNFLNVDGTFWSPLVSDLYVPEQLGYTYGTSPNVVAAAGARRIALNNTLTNLAIGTAGAIQGATTVTVENSKTATAAEPLSIPVKIPEAALAAILQSPPIPSGAATANFAAAQEAAESRPRALAFLRDVDITDPSTTSFRVFLDGQGIGPDTPVEDPHYVGTFALLDHGGGHGGDGHDTAPSFVIDLTDAIQRVYGSGAPPDGTANLQIVPVPVPGGTAGSATPKALEIAIVSA
jgi:tyrosinase